MSSYEKNAVLLGAGQFGRGVIAMLLERAGYHVLLADQNQEVIDDLQKRRHYVIRRPGGQEESMTVSNISAMNSEDPDFAGRCAQSSLICTCVGLSSLKKIAPHLAECIRLRYVRDVKEPLNILACENALGASTVLKKDICALLNEEERTYLEEFVGFPDCAIDGIIPPAEKSLPADVTAEAYYEWDVRRSGFRGPVPEIQGLHAVDSLNAYLERKLFTLNGPNAVTGALGYRKGYRTVQQALADPDIRTLVWTMMEEAGKMLEKRHGFTAEEMLSYRTFILQRFMNEQVIDTCERVAREPIRKLGKNDRIVAAMNYAAQSGVPTPSYYKGIAALMVYDNPKDSQCCELQKTIREEGFSAALRKYTGIGEDSPEGQEIVKEYRLLTE